MSQPIQRVTVARSPSSTQAPSRSQGLATATPPGNWTSAEPAGIFASGRDVDGPMLAGIDGGASCGSKPVIARSPRLSSGDQFRIVEQEGVPFRVPQLEREDPPATSGGSRAHRPES